MTPKRLSLYQRHVQYWREGCGSEICQYAQNKCFVRGDIPCDVCFVGEAPGESENALGLPFIGVSGKLLDFIAGEAIPTDMTTAFTNLVCCIPRSEDGGKAGQPPHEAILQCQPRLGDILHILKPKLIVEVGTLARDYLDPHYASGLKTGVPQVFMFHPSYMLSRLNEVQRDVEVRRSIINIRDAIKKLKGGSDA